MSIASDIASIKGNLPPDCIADARTVLTWLRGNKIDWAARFFLGSIKKSNFGEFKIFARLNGKRVNNIGKPEMNAAIKRLRQRLLPPSLSGLVE